MQNLVTGKKDQFNKASAFKFDKSSTWLEITSDESKELQLYNLKSGKALSFPSVSSYSISQNGKALLIKQKTGGVLYADLTTSKTAIIWQPLTATQTIKEFNIDLSSKQVVFTVEDESKNISIWYWKEGMKKALMRINHETNGIDNLLIQPTASFTENGKYIRLSLLPKLDEHKPMEDAVQLDIWSSGDKVLQSTQAYLSKKKRLSFQALLNVETGKIVFLESQEEKLGRLQGDFAIIQKRNRDVYGDRFWEKDYDKDSNWLVFLKNSRRTSLPTRGIFNSFWFSPSGKYLVYYDQEKDCNYFSYNLKTNEIKNISQNVPSGQLSHVDLYLRTDEKKSNYPCGPVAWMERDEELLVYDDYDIWKLDLSGKRPAVNITNGYGRKHNTQLSFLNNDRFNVEISVISKNENLLLRAFNQQNKYNGFFITSFSNGGDPEELFMGPYFFEKVNGNGSLPNGMTPFKAADKNTWIVLRQSAIEAPNYFQTNDFKTYKQLTNTQSHKAYNWLTSELIAFSQLDGTMSQGVLYKPENFDSKKKYPVIISFYDRLSDRLNTYPVPGYIDGPLIDENPAWMVSHGYLVFLPDMYFTNNQWGPSTVNTINGSARYLKTLPYVDSAHLGAVGHSNSGRFGYYLLTHSNSFAAMSVGSGVTNAISTALRFTGPEERSALEILEVSSLGTGLGNLWQNKERWMDHTAVLNADKVSSPLLLFDNKQDGAFKAGAGLEMYISLRRLEKPVWWLQYDQGAHRLVRKGDMRDFTIRYTQFFDHYLRRAPEPEWMKTGIPYKQKGIISGYELDF